MKTFILLACAWLWATAGGAYVTSAVLEYCADDAVAFHLNGSVLKARTEFAPFNYGILATADGTLPMELFLENQKNLLAVENFDIGAGSMTVSFRLTVHHSDGDPVVIWSDPEQSKFLHLSKEQKNPLGWTQPGFDDSAWGEAKGVHVSTGHQDGARLEDASFGGILRAGYVPYLSHRADAKCRSADHNLFRSWFSFPNNPAKVGTLISPQRASAGQPLTIRLIPGADTTELSQFTLLAWLPKSLQVSAASPGARFEKKLGRVSWAFSNRDMKVGYLQLNAARVLRASGWAAPEKALGPKKTKPGRDTENIPGVLMNDGAGAVPGVEGWFKLEEPAIDLSQGEPIIQGVLFRSQIKMGGRDANLKREVDKMNFNYSVNGGAMRALPKDVNVARSSDPQWLDGYYHASEDREWTWKDIRGLAVMFEAEPVGRRDKNLLSSVTCIVRYYYPGRVQPYVTAKVLENRCAELQVSTGIYRHGSKLVSSDPVKLRVNEQLCPPTPIPTLAPTPIPIELARPQATPTPSGGKQGVRALGLGCLTVAPEPMDYGGAFISFCLKSNARVMVNLYQEGQTSTGVRRIESREFRAGDCQIFFNGMDDKGALLKPGRYLCELVAERDGLKEAHNTRFQIVKKRPKR